MADLSNDSIDAGFGGAGAPGPAAASDAPPRRSPRDAIVDALMELAAEREWVDISVSDIAERAGVSLAEFREAFPSKGAVLAGFSRKIDTIVLSKSGQDLKDEAPKERLFDVLMRRLDAMAPYRPGLEGVADWLRQDPLAVAALNRTAVNSMRFMLEAAGIDTEGQTGALKIQGLVLAWSRVLSVWLKDDDPSLARTMAALDRELTRGETLAARVDDVGRLLAPLRLLARGMMNGSRRAGDRHVSEPSRDGFSSDPAGAP
jgi:AcrR family transcriptional regulator